MDFYTKLLSIRDDLIKDVLDNATPSHETVETCNQLLDYMDSMDSQDNRQSITKDEALSLINFLDTCGYINHETHPIVHTIYTKLDNFLKC